MNHIYKVFFLYTISYEWNLNAINTNALFQSKDSKQSFYFDSRFHMWYSLNQVVKRDNKYFLFLKFESNHPDELYVYSSKTSTKTTATATIFLNPCVSFPCQKMEHVNELIITIIHFLVIREFLMESTVKFVNITN